MILTDAVTTLEVIQKKTTPEAIQAHTYVTIGTRVFYTHPRGPLLLPGVCAEAASAHTPVC